MTGGPISRLDDNDLVARVAAGDVRAFEALYDRYSAQAFGLAMYVTGRAGAAEEVTQDAFISLWRMARVYDAGRGTFRSWLLSVVRHRGIDWLRRGRREACDVEIDGAIGARLAAAELVEERVADAEQSRHTRELLTGLPDEQRQVIELSFFKGLSQSEIAARLGIPLGTVKGRQRLALAKLQQALSGEPVLAVAG